jgi:hypothetical protein
MLLAILRRDYDPSNSRFYIPERTVAMAGKPRHPITLSSVRRRCPLFPTHPNFPTHTPIVYHNISCARHHHSSLPVYPPRAPPHIPPLEVLLSHKEAIPYACTPCPTRLNCRVRVARALACLKHFNGCGCSPRRSRSMLPPRLRGTIHQGATHVGRCPPWAQRIRVPRR